MRNIELTVRGVAAVLILWGLYKIIGDSRYIWVSLRYGLFSSDTDMKLFWLLVLFLVFSAVIPLVAIIAAWGLFEFQRWGHRLALSVCTLMFVVTSVGGITFLVRSYNAIDVPVPVIPEGSVGVYMSMWPTYITAFVSGLLILLLSWRPIRTRFAEKGYA